MGVKKNHTLALVGDPVQPISFPDCRVGMSSSQLLCAVLLLFWVIFNSIGNLLAVIYLAACPDALLLSAASFLVAALSAPFFIQKPLTDVLTLEHFRCTCPIAAFHLSNTLLTFMSLESGSIALTYMIKVLLRAGEATADFIRVQSLLSLQYYRSLCSMMFNRCEHTSL